MKRKLIWVQRLKKKKRIFIRAPFKSSSERLTKFNKYLNFTLFVFQTLFITIITYPPTPFSLSNWFLLHLTRTHTHAHTNTEKIQTCIHTVLLSTHPRSHAKGTDVHVKTTLCRMRCYCKHNTADQSPNSPSVQRNICSVEETRHIFTSSWGKGKSHHWNISSLFKMSSRSFDSNLTPVPEFTGISQTQIYSTQSNVAF